MVRFCWHFCSLAVLNVQWVNCPLVVFSSCHVQFSVLGASEQRDLVFQCIKQWQAASSSSSSRASGSGRERDINRLASSSGVDTDADDAMIDDVLGDEIGGERNGAMNTVCRP